MVLVVSKPTLIAEEWKKFSVTRSGTETEYNACESAVERVKVKQEEFVGKSAHLQHRQEKLSAILCTMTLDLPSSGSYSRYPVGVLPIIDPDTKTVPIDGKGRRSCGTSTSYCPSIGKHVVMGYLPKDIAYQGKTLLLEYFNHNARWSLPNDSPNSWQGLAL